MICITTRYFDINRILLLALGLWPYQQSKLVRLQVILLFVILASSITFQFTAFLTAECTPTFIVKVLSHTSLFMPFIIKYNSFWINSKTLKHLLEQLQHICNQLKDENEISIIEKYGCVARNYTIKITLYFMSSAFSIIALPITQTILRTLLRMNDSQLLRPMQMQTEYFIDGKKYSNVILIHTAIAFFIGVMVVVATGCMLIACLKYACGMFEITSYRIEQAMLSKTQNNSFENNTMVYKKLIHAVYIHRKAMEFSTYLISRFEGTFFLLIIVGVASLSFNLVRIFQVAQDHIEEMILHLTIVLLILIYMFLANYIGQEITDSNNQIFSTVYNVQWYMAPLQIQKLMLFLLQRGNKTFGLNVGGLFVSSIECFSKLASASISYFTVMYSMQK